MVLGILIVLILTGAAAGGVIWKKGQERKTTEGLPAGRQVVVPTIVNGELILPQGVKVGLETAAQAGKNISEQRVYVLSANLVGVFDKEGKLTGVRALGEIKNITGKRIEGVVPVVRFMDKDGKVLAQKIGRNNDSFDFFGLEDGETAVYDVIADEPPADSDRIEVVFQAQENAAAKGKTALKIVNRGITPQEVQTQDGKKTQVFTISGKVFNSEELAVTEITVLAYVKDKEGKILGLGRQDFKADLIPSGESIPFKIMVLPIKLDTEYDDYGVAVWGKEFRF